MVVATEAVVEYNVCLSTRQRESPSVLSLQTPSSPCPSFCDSHYDGQLYVLQVTETGRFCESFNNEEDTNQEDVTIN